MSSKKRGRIGQARLNNMAFPMRLHRPVLSHQDGNYRESHRTSWKCKSESNIRTDGRYDGHNRSMPGSSDKQDI